MSGCVSTKDIDPTPGVNNILTNYYATVEPN